ncbi:unnamed protein product [Strongylus vulgaris]|uniref:Uncharacterized protein n=1 Tax=Strongylus vulgaris TaxID=40348 RepID=A0A3P7LNN6_STRVU|nr:unnamed protein product [Strongylus vulgaris]
MTMAVTGQYVDCKWPHNIGLTDDQRRKVQDTVKWEAGVEAHARVLNAPAKATVILVGLFGIVAEAKDFRFFLNF